MTSSEMSSSETLPEDTGRRFVRGVHETLLGAADALGDDEVELGVGIHGERAARRVPFTSADGLTDLLLDPLLEELGLERGTEVLAIVNGLGGTYPLELNLVARRLHHRLDDAGIAVGRSLVGSYVTSLDMHGISITLMPLEDEQAKLWDAAVRTPALTW